MSRTQDRHEFRAHYWQGWTGSESAQIGADRPQTVGAAVAGSNRTDVQAAGYRAGWADADAGRNFDAHAAWHLFDAIRDAERAAATGYTPIAATRGNEYAFRAAFTIDAAADAYRKGWAAAYRATRGDDGAAATIRYRTRNGAKYVPAFQQAWADYTGGEPMTRAEGLERMRLLLTYGDRNAAATYVDLPNEEPTPDDHPCSCQDGSPVADGDRYRCNGCGGTIPAVAPAPTFDHEPTPRADAEPVYPVNLVCAWCAMDHNDYTTVPAVRFVRPAHGGPRWPGCQRHADDAVARGASVGPDAAEADADAVEMIEW